MSSADEHLLDGVVVPTGTYQLDNEDPCYPSIATQRRHAVRLAMRAAALHGFDLDSYEQGVTPIPPHLRRDLKLLLDAHGDLVADYVASVRRPHG